MLRTILSIMALSLLFVGSISGIISLIYFGAELINGAGFLAAAWSGLKVFGLGIASIVLGLVFGITVKSMK